MHHFIRRVHAPNEVTANVLFAVAERTLLLGKALRWGVVATLGNILSLAFLNRALYW